MGWTRRSKEHAAEQTPFQVLRPKKLVSLTLRSSDIIAAPIFKTNLARAKVAGCHWLSCDFTFGKTKRPNSHVSFPSAMSSKCSSQFVLHPMPIYKRNTFCTNQQTRNMKRNNIVTDIVAIVELWLANFCVCDYLISSTSPVKERSVPSQGWCK